jgi:small subunit ribosomal protein S11
VYDDVTRKTNSMKLTSSTRSIKIPNSNKITELILHIKFSFNNTLVTVTNSEGNTIFWVSSGLLGLKGGRKSSLYGVQLVCESVCKKLKVFGTRFIRLKISGMSSSRDSTLRLFKSSGFKILSMTEVSSKPYNGCRPPKKRRI